MIKCKKCNSKIIETSITDFKVIRFFVNDSIPVFIKKYQCKECNYEWEE